MGCFVPRVLAAPLRRREGRLGGWGGEGGIVQAIAGGKGGRKVDDWGGYGFKRFAGGVNINLGK